MIDHIQKHTMCLFNEKKKIKNVFLDIITLFFTIIECIFLCHNPQCHIIELCVHLIRIIDF